MQTAKLFQNGQSQAVRLPKDFRFEGVEVGIGRIGSMVFLYQPDKAWENFLASPAMTDDFFESISRRYEGLSQTAREEL